MEPIEIVAENGDVWRVRECKNPRHHNCIVLSQWVAPFTANYEVAQLNAHIPADVLPRIVEAMKGMVKA